MGGSKNNIETIKNVVEILAIIAAGLFFLYKVLDGIDLTNLSVEINSQRKVIDKQFDHLTVKAKIKNGENGAVTLRDARVRARVDQNYYETSFFGIHNLDLGEKHDVYQIPESWNVLSDSTYRMSIKEQTEFAAYLKIPTGKVCFIQVALVGERRRYAGFFPVSHHWGASTISLPLQPSF